MPQLCCSSPKLFWLLGVFHGFIWFFLLLWRLSLEFWYGWYWFCSYYNINNINSCNSCKWDIFPFTYIFNFLQLMSDSFQHINLSPPWLNLLLSIVFFFDALTFSTVLNISHEIGHSDLAPDIRGRSSSFSPLSMILSLGLLCISFLMLGRIFSITNLLRVFIMKACWILSTFFYIGWEGPTMFILQFC
jgi:hypothetical protein